MFAIIAVTAALLGPRPGAAGEGQFQVVEAGIVDVHAAFAAGTLTSSALVRMYLDRIEAYDQRGPMLNAVLDLNPMALADAARLDAAYAASGPVGPLHGIPVLLKDQIDAAGMRTTLGSVLLEDYRPSRDAFVVEKLKAAGAIILGKVTLGELGGGNTYGSLFGATRNPYAPARTVGGSSGGTGAALAASFATVGLGQEGFSSIRRPSAWNNVVGMRPTAGMISRGGVWAGWPSPHGSAGPMARSVEDLARLLDVMVGYDPEDPLSAHGVGHAPETYTAFLDKGALEGARIGVIRAPMTTSSAPDSADFQKVDAAFDAAVAELRAAGAVIIDDIVIPNVPEAIGLRADAPGADEASWNDYFLRNAADAPYKSQAEMYSTENIARVAPTKRMRADQAEPSLAEQRERYAEYIAARDQVWVDVLRIMADHDLDALVHKSTEHQPGLIVDETTPPYARNRGSVALNTFLVFMPVLSVPAGFTSDGLPIGITFTGRPYDEPTLIKLGYAYEQATRHRRAPATTPPLTAAVMAAPLASATPAAARPAAQPSTPQRMFDLQTATIEDIQAAMDSGALTAEKLVQLYLNRIAAYDQRGPRINAVITLQPRAIEIARALDAERQATGPRSLLHGVPVVLKDLFDTHDMPTTAGFLPMKDSQPIHDATVVARLREAGAVILAKVNMSDWFGTPPRGDQSTILGRTLNPYNLDLTPGGSSGGTGAALAASFAQIGLGSETGVSIRNPTSNNSLVGIAPTRGLIPRTGQVMTSFTQERAGPMGRSVYDVAALTDVVAGFDAEDLLTIVAPGRTPAESYTTFLDKDGLRGARIGVFRDLFREGEMHAEGIALIEAAIEEMRAAGAVIVDPISTGIDLLDLLEDTRTNYYEGQFSYNLYFRRLGPDAPIRNMDELIARGGDLVKPNILRAYQEFDSLMHHPDFLARRDSQEMLQALVIALLDRYRLDALVHPFKSVPPEPHLARQAEKDNPLSSVTGLPAVLVPAGYTQAQNGPIAIEFLGRPFSEPTLFKLAYGYEQISHQRVPPASTPALPGERFAY